MEKEDFKKRVLEQTIFEENKDKPLGNAEKFKKKYEGNELDLTALYIKIVNYQVEKYGCSLDKYANIPTCFERDKLRIRSNQRKHRRLH